MHNPIQCPAPLNGYLHALVLELQGVTDEQLQEWHDTDQRERAERGIDPESTDEVADMLDWTALEEASWSQQDQIDLYRGEY